MITVIAASTLSKQGLIKSANINENLCGLGSRLNNVYNLDR